MRGGDKVTVGEIMWEIRVKEVEDRYDDKVKWKIRKGKKEREGE